MLRVGEFALATGGGVWVAAGVYPDLARYYEEAIDRYLDKLLAVNEAIEEAAA